MISSSHFIKIFVYAIYIEVETSKFRKKLKRRIHKCSDFGDILPEETDNKASLILKFFIFKTIQQFYFQLRTCKFSTQYFLLQ